jgi:pyrroline-5-carboxylate reductase
MTAKLLLVGCGKMGSALLQQVASEAVVCVVDPATPSGQLKALSGVAWLSNADEIDPRFIPDVIILAVKPQLIATVLPTYTQFKDSVFLSIAAGQTMTNLAAILGSKNYAVVRAMPNLPASIAHGMTVAVANKNVTPAQQAMCEKFLKAIGKVSWVVDEGWLDAVTALSGSGPAYVFALTECMAKAGETLGLQPKLAAELARETIIGSAAMLAQTTESPENLRIAVTSRGGTTEAALSKLLASPGGLPDLILKTMKAALSRAKQFAQ